MGKILKSIIAPLISLLILVLGTGFFMTYLTVRLRLEGFGTAAAGYVTAAYYGGLFLGSFKSEKYISRLGLIKSYALFAVITAVLSMLQGLYINPWFWVILRFFGGFAMAALFIVTESWFLVKSTHETRGKVLSIYMIIFYGGIALAQLLLDIPNLSSFTPFAITGILCCVSILPIMMTNKTAPKAMEASFLNVFKLFKASPLGFIGCVISGVMLGTIYGLSPSYAKDIQMNVSEIAIYMGVTIFGGLLLQWPLGHLSDRVDRRNVIFLAAIATLLLSLAIAFQGNAYPNLLLLTALIFGGFSFTLYPLCLSHSCDFVPAKDYVAASGGLQIAYGIGAIIGPLTAPLSMRAMGPSGLYFYFCGVAGLLALFALGSLWKKKRSRHKEKYIYGNLPNSPLIIPEKGSIKQSLKK